MVGDFRIDRRTFGGRIYSYDYDEGASLVDMANRIMADIKFDQRCRKYVENKLSTKVGR